MTEVERIVELLTEAYFGEAGRNGTAWHGTSVNAIMNGIDAAMAAKHPAGSPHSIWELALHIAVWDEICARRVHGETIATTTGDPEDWPVLPTRLDEEAWQKTLTRLRKAQETMITAARSLDENQLEVIVAGRPWNFYLMLHGTLHHDLHHAGQIALLKRMVG